MSYKYLVWVGLGINNPVESLEWLLEMMKGMTEHVLGALELTARSMEPAQTGAPLEMVRPAPWRLAIALATG